MIAIVFGRKKGAVAGAFGMCLFDILSGWVAWAPFTFVIRGTMGLIIGTAAHANGKKGNSIIYNAFLSISRRAWNKILNRRKPITGFYCNLALWKDWYKEKWFPYTQPISDLYGFAVAVKRALGDQHIIQRHLKIANALRKAIQSSGLELYPVSGFSNTVTTIKVPGNVTFKTIFDEMLNENHIMIAGAFDFLKDRVFRIGHMGENCYEDKVFITLKALDEVLRKHNVPLTKKLYEEFANNMEK